MIFQGVRPVNTVPHTHGGIIVTVLVNIAHYLV